MVVTWQLFLTLDAGTLINVTPEILAPTCLRTKKITIILVC